MIIARIITNTCTEMGKCPKNLSSTALLKNVRSKPKCKLKVHVEFYHSGGVRKKKIACPFCSKTFGHSEFMQNHLRSHTQEKPWRCSLCSYESKFSYHLKCQKEAVHREFMKLKEQWRRICQICNFSTSVTTNFKLLTLT